MKSPTRPQLIPASLLRSLAAAGLLAAFGATTAVADIVYVTSQVQGCTTTSQCSVGNTDGTYVEVNMTLGNTGIKGSAAGRPVTPNSSRAYLSSAFYSNTEGGVDLKPTLGASSADGSVVYQIDYNFNSSGGNVTTNVIMNMTCTGGTLSSNSTPLFQRSYGTATKWLFMGYLTNTTTTPTISFRYASGDVSGAGSPASAQSRLLLDCWRFTKVENCLATPVVTPDGPIATNLTTVNVAGVSPTATQVKVYQIVGNATNLLGSATVSNPGATVPVTVSGMVKTAHVIATQVVNGQEGCLPVAGTPAGGGSNPRLRLAASVRQDSGATGPIGAVGTGGGANIYWIHATGSTVAGGLVLQPSTNWQTVVFYPWDSKYGWNGTVALPEKNHYGYFEGLALAIDDLTDTGPFDIYIDNFRNANTVITDFELAAQGDQALFRQPTFSGTTSDNILNNPNEAAVWNTYAATGTNSHRATWQYKDLAAGRWVRLNAGVGATNVAAGIIPNAQVDVTQPIAFDILLLPSGKTNAHSMGSMGLIPPATVCHGDSVIFTEIMTPPAGTTPSYTYQWAKNGTAITGATSSSLTVGPVTAASAGTYSVTVSDGAASGTVSTTLNYVPTVAITAQPFNSSKTPIGTFAAFSVTAENASQCPCANNPALTYQWYHNGTLIPSATDAMYANYAVTMADVGSYWVVVSNTCSGQTATSDTAKLYVYDSNLGEGVYGCGMGILGLYWTNHTAAAPFTGDAAYTNADISIAWTWAADSFSPQFPEATNNFTARWVGTVQAPYNNQHYTFYTTTDDGVRLWVNGQLLVDKWVDQSATTWSGTILLGTNTPADIVMEYYEKGGDATAILAWDSESVPNGPIPGTAFCPADPSTSIPPLTTLTAPANNATATMPATVTLTAGVTQFSAPVSKVEFYNNGTNLLATVPAPGPYTTSWTPSATGVYNISAKTYYNTSRFLTSPANKLTVNTPALAGVTITNISGTTLKYTGGSGSQFVLLNSADVSAPLSSWTRVATNAATPGSFTVPAVGSAAQTYYRIKSE